MTAVIPQLFWFDEKHHLIFQIMPNCISQFPKTREIVAGYITKFAFRFPVSVQTVLFPNPHLTSRSRSLKIVIDKLINSKEMTRLAGPDPMWTNCPNCDTEVITTTQKSISTFQCVIGGALCLFCYCCWCIPFCKNDWKDVLHTCPNCNYVLGRYNCLFSTSMFVKNSLFNDNKTYGKVLKQKSG